MTKKLKIEQLEKASGAVIADFDGFYCCSCNKYLDKYDCESKNVEEGCHVYKEYKCKYCKTWQRPNQK